MYYVVNHSIFHEGREHKQNKKMGIKLFAMHSPQGIVHQSILHEGRQHKQNKKRDSRLFAMHSPQGIVHQSILHEGIQHKQIGFKEFIRFLHIYM